MNIKKWVISALTIASLGTGGYKVLDWDNEDGYIVADTTGLTDDTLAFKDSTKLADFGRLNKDRLGAFILK